MMRKGLKGLFITHQVGYCGAEKSLSALLGSLEGVDITVFIPVASPLKRSNNLVEIQKEHFPMATCVREFHLPKDCRYEGRPKGIWQFIKNLGREFFWHYFKKDLYRNIENEGFDFIHLNSSVLHPVIRKGFPFFMHVRERIVCPNSRFKNDIEAAKGVLFIDEVTRSFCKDYKLSNVTVLNNPVDMRLVLNQPVDQILRQYRLSSKNIVFSVVGSLIEDKGVVNIIDGFRKVGDINARLLVVGEIKGRYARKCWRHAKGDNRVIFVGKEQFIERIYAITDYVVRGDPRFAIGRTILEGLYCGCNAIIPAMPTEVDDEPALMQFRDKIHTYIPGDVDRLGAVLSVLADKKTLKVNLGANTDLYQKEFLKFVL